MITATVIKWYRTWEHVSQQDRIWFIVSLILIITHITWRLWGKYASIGKTSYIPHLGKGRKLMEVLEGAEELKTDTGCYDEQTHCKEDQTAKLLSRTKDLHKTKKSSITNHTYIFNLIFSRLIPSNLWWFHSIWHILSQTQSYTYVNLTRVSKA